MYVLGWLTFILLASGKQQSWNTPYENLLVPIEIPREPRKPLMASVLENGGYSSCNSEEDLGTLDAVANYWH